MTDEQLERALRHIELVLHQDQREATLWLSVPTEEGDTRIDVLDAYQTRHHPSGKSETHITVHLYKLERAIRRLAAIYSDGEENG